MIIKNENDLLLYIKKNICISSPSVIKSIGDDCAVIKINSKKYFVFTTDTSLEGPHFSKKYSPHEIGYKSLATNLSDIAAMGCIPKYVLMSLTLPHLDDKWVKSFYSGIKKLISKYKLTLIGGDTNCGPMSISIQVIGINKGKILYRDKARNKDDIYVSGALGSARASLMLEKTKKYKKEQQILRKFLRTPKPRIELGKAISSVANSCIDISDGLIKDLDLILTGSKLGAYIFVDRIPVHPILKKVIPSEKYFECVLGGGEDYELCFTAPKNKRSMIKRISSALKQRITLIGSTNKEKILFYNNNKPIKFNFKGFDHFA